ncbi:MAG: hypothetical protein ABI687_07915 [Flavitalea sp.]
MNKYLLLRDNKESGPYTADEIISKGIKPYDLVWMEGRSAAWRYPSEIEELKAYAPLVEEQPFDRFYKKPAESPASGAQTISISSPLYTPLYTDHTPYLPKETEPSRKIYINFPGSRVETAISAPEKRNEPLFPPSGQTVNERAMTEKTSPVREEREIGSPPTSFTPESAFFSRQTFQKPKSSWTQQAFRWTIAACLLLGGVLIGLSITYSNQRSNISQMNGIIQRIEQREKQPSQPSSDPEMIRQAVHQLPADNIPVSSGNNSITTVETPKLATARKISSGKTSSHSTAPQQLSTEAPAVTAASTKVAKEEKSTPVDEPAKEQSRENLFKLLSIKTNKYKTGVLGGISNLQLELTNNSLINIQQVEVEVKYLGIEKKIVRSQTVYFQDIKPGEQLTVDVPKSSRGISVEYMISKIN